MMWVGGSIAETESLLYVGGERLTFIMLMQIAKYENSIMA